MSSLNCNYCQRTNADFQLCPECSNAHYCSLGCLKLDRPSHEKVCGKEKNISEASSLSKTHETKLKLNKPSEECNETCNRCFASGPTKRCTGCLAVNYCSKKCQSEDWHTHKTECRHTTTIKGKHPYGGVQSAEESLKVTTQEQTVESPPNGYLWRLQNKCQLLYSPFKVISCIKMITQDPLDALMKVFVGFINKFSEREVNHGVYVLDAEDKEVKVEFHLDDVFSCFPYEKVKPGNFICITGPWLQKLQDGSMGIKIEFEIFVRLFERKELGY